MIPADAKKELIEGVVLLSTGCVLLKLLLMELTHLVEFCQEAFRRLWLKH